jgi:hypothetical protein
MVNDFPSDSAQVSRACFVSLSKEVGNGWKVRTRAFDEKVESLIVDTGRIGFKIPTGAKGASHEWGSLIPTICANVSLRQSKPVIAV